MCGIVGVINPTTAAHEKFFEQALIVDQLRGFHSTGAYAVTAKEVLWHKAAVIGTVFVGQPEFRGMLATKGLLALVGHNRWATQGDVNKRNAHPFHHGDITLVHNGTLREDAPGVKKDQFGTDSEGIAYALSRPDATAEAVLGQLSGAFALVWHDLHDNCVRMIRNDDRPLWLVKCKWTDTLLFASEPKMIEWLAARNRIDLEGAPTQIAKDTLYRFDLNRPLGADRIKPHIKQVQLRPTYDYYSGYGVGTNWARGYRRTKWEEEEDFPAKRKEHAGPANRQPAALLTAPRIRETVMSPAERDEFLKAAGTVMHEEIVCSVLSTTLDRNNTFTIEAVYDQCGPGVEVEADVVTYNIKAPLSSKAALQDAAYICGKVINARKIDGRPVIILNPRTVWIADSSWKSIYEGEDVVRAVLGENKPVLMLPGPGGQMIVDTKWKELTADGCASCGVRINSREAELLEWVGDKPLCHHCAEDDEAVAKVAQIH
jgi:hypothetical protein